MAGSNMMRVVVKNICPKVVVKQGGGPAVLVDRQRYLCDVVTYEFLNASDGIIYKYSVGDYAGGGSGCVVRRVKNGAAAGAVKWDVTKPSTQAQLESLVYS